MTTEHVRRATEDEMEKIREIVADIEVAMLTTTSREGDVRSRPMGTVLDAGAAGVWLFLSPDSHAAAEIRAQPRVGLIYADPERDRYVSLAGRAQFVEDPAQVRRLWRPEFGKWFPGGPGDPSLALLHVSVTQAEFWDDSAKLMSNFFETIGAPYSGLPPEAVGEHARVRPLRSDRKSASTHEGPPS
jgi:general stress protein 26